MMPAEATRATPERIFEDLLAGNRRFVAGLPQTRDLVREREALIREQHPKAIVLACSDSRVAPEIIFDQGLGDLFVIRTAGNVADKLGIGSIEYAAEVVACSLLVVIGHQGCAAVKAACEKERFSSPHLAAVVKAIRSSFTFEPGDDDESMRRAEQQNVRFVAHALLDRSELLHRRVTEGKLSVVAAYYRFDRGVVERLA